MGYRAFILLFPCIITGLLKSVKRPDPNPQVLLNQNFRKSKYSPEKKQMRYRVTPIGLENIFHSIRQGKPDAALTELKSLIVVKRPSAARKDAHFELTKFHYDDIIKEFGDKGYLNECDEVLTLMKSNGVLPTIITFTYLISRSASWQLIKKVESYFQMMSSYNIVPDVRVYNSLINAYAKCGNIKESYSILTQMRQQNIYPTVVTYNTLIDCCARMKPQKHVNLVELALDIVMLMKQSGIEPNERSFSSLIHVYCQCHQLQKGFDLLRYMTDTLHITPSPIAYSVLIHAYGQSGDLSTAFQLLQTMKAHHYEPNIITMSSLIHACSKHGHIDKAYELYTHLLQNYTKDNNVENKPNSITCSCLIDSYLKAGNIDKMLTILQDMENHNIPLTQVTYTSLMCELTKLKRFDLIQSIAQHKTHAPSQSSIVKNNHNLTIEIERSYPTRNDLDKVSVCSHRIPNQNSEDALNGTVGSLVVKAGNDNVKSASSGIKTNINRNTLKSNALGVKYYISNVGPSQLQHGIMASGKTYSEHVSEYERLKASGIAPTPLVYQILLRKLYTQSLSKSPISKPVQIVDPRNVASALIESSSAITAESSSSPSTSSNQSSDHGTHIVKSADSSSTALVNVSIHKDDLFRLYLLFQEMRGAGVQPDIVAYNMLINACAAAGAVDNALETVETMQKEGVAPDVITYTSLIKACAINGGGNMVQLAENIFDTMQQRTNHFSSYIEPTELTFQRLIQTHLNAKLVPNHPHDNVRHQNEMTSGDKIVNTRVNDTGMCLQNHSLAHNVNTRRVHELYNDMLKRGIAPNLQIYRYCIRAATLDANIPLALSYIQSIQKNKIKYDYKSWLSVLHACKTNTSFATDELLLRNDILQKRGSIPEE